VILQGGQTKLLEVVLALGPISRLASRLHRGEQERHQYAYYGNDHEQFDEGEAG
jgi:hypothetical protein